MKKTISFLLIPCILFSCTKDNIQEHQQYHNTARNTNVAPVNSLSTQHDTLNNNGQSLKKKVVKIKYPRPRQ